MQFSRQLAFESGFNVDAVLFGDLTVTKGEFEGEKLRDTDSSGVAVGIFAGIVLSFPSR